MIQQKIVEAGQDINLPISLKTEYMGKFCSVPVQAIVCDYLTLTLAVCQLSYTLGIEDFECMKEFTALKRFLKDLRCDNIGDESIFY